MKSSTGVVALLAIFFLAHGPQHILGDPPPDPKNGSYIFTMVVDGHNKIQLHGKPYVAQPGDLILFDDHIKWISVMYHLVGTSAPVHAAIVIRRPDGSMGLLEAGPNMVPKVFIFDLVPRLQGYNGTLLVRRLKKQISAEQSARLTEFALAQEGKSYSWIRLLMQGTPFRPRGPIRTYCFGHTCFDRNRWTCCELVAAAACIAGILDAKVHHANAMYPRDFAYDEVYNLNPYYLPTELWYPRAEPTWVGNGVVTGYPGPSKPLPK